MNPSVVLRLARTIPANDPVVVIPTGVDPADLAAIFQDLYLKGLVVRLAILLFALLRAEHPARPGATKLSDRVLQPLPAQPAHSATHRTKPDDRLWQLLFLPSFRYSPGFSS